MTVTASKDSIASAWNSFLGTLSGKRVFVFDHWNFTTRDGIDDFVSLLQANHVTPIVITRVSAQPNFGDLLSFDRYPTDLPSFNLEPGKSDITVGELVNLALAADFDITGCASDFDLDDISLAEATVADGAPAFAFREHRITAPKLPANVTEIRHFIHARFRRSPRRGMQQQEHLPMTEALRAQQMLRHDQ